MCFCSFWLQLLLFLFFFSPPFSSQSKVPLDSPPPLSLSWRWRRKVHSERISSRLQSVTVWSTFAVSSSFPSFFLPGRAETDDSFKIPSAFFPTLYFVTENVKSSLNIVCVSFLSLALSSFWIKSKDQSPSSLPPKSTYSLLYGKILDCTVCAIEFRATISPPLINTQNRHTLKKHHPFHVTHSNARFYCNADTTLCRRPLVSCCCCRWVDRKLHSRTRLHGESEGGRLTVAVASLQAVGTLDLVVLSVEPGHRHPLAGRVHLVDGVLQGGNRVANVIVNYCQVEEVPVRLAQHLRLFRQPLQTAVVLQEKENRVKLNWLTRNKEGGCFQWNTRRDVSFSVMTGGSVVIGN